MRKYSPKDFQFLPKPRITRVVKRYGTVVYTWLCQCDSGSRGYGTTPEHAYAKWLRSWQRRKAWYARPHGWSTP